jgi:hypothetical protein
VCLITVDNNLFFDRDNGVQERPSSELSEKYTGRRIVLKVTSHQILLYLVRLAVSDHMLESIIIKLYNERYIIR